MSLSQGSVTVTGLDGSDNPVGTSTGAAGAVFVGLTGALGAPTVPSLGSTSAPYSPGRPSNAQDQTNARVARLTFFQNMANMATGIAAIIPYVTTNAVVNPGTLVAHVTTQSLGVTPNPNTAATAIGAPASPVDVPLAGGGTLS